MLFPVMSSARWLRPPRSIVIVFLSLALVSGGALGWLAWQLLKQDEALDVQRQQERLEQAADRAADVMQRSLAELQSLVTRPETALRVPVGVSVVTIASGDVTAVPDGSLPYYPSPVALETRDEAFADGERLEFVARELRGAIDAYETLATSKEAARRAGALARLARVQRKQQDPDAALRTYVRLAEVSGKVSVDGIPATLVARAGRASVLEASNRTSELRDEAEALQQDLLRGRWPLSRSEYEYYSAQVRQWLGTAPPEDRDALGRAEAVEWLWQNRSVVATSRRVVTTTHGPILVEWSGDADRLVAIVAGPAYLDSLRSNATPAGLELLLSDTEGRPFLGDAPRRPQVAVRTASAAGLPWTLDVSTDPASIVPASPRRRLLTLVFLVIALVLAAGWYFILRAISRERRVSQLQTDFVAAVSHEFRSPMTSLAHIAEMLAQDRMPSDDVRKQAYEVLVRDTDRLRRLVEDLLDFGRFEAGAASLRFEPVDIAELVRGTVADFRDRVQRDGFAIECTGTTDSVFVRADREAVSRALWNLLDNAVKYSPQSRTVWVDMERNRDLVSVTVRDQGIGIPLQEQGEIFDRFVRGSESKARRIKGTGIGLAMVRHIVQAHGGEVRVASEPGRGSRFTMVLHTAEGVA